jgi:FkbM family methyltransferase
MREACAASSDYRRVTTMSWHTHPLVIWSRNVGRRTGINPWLARLRQPRGYEARFERAMFAALRPGDCVWDVGANVGHYTAAFALRVGSSGHVVAFEPSPINFARLTAHLTGFDNVTPLCLALGSMSGQLPFEQGADELGATSHISERPRSDMAEEPLAGRPASVSLAAGDAVPGDAPFLVPVERGQELVTSGRVRKPTFIKIDTEGHELEVLHGLGELLDDPELRVLCIEMHFGLLAKQSREHAPRFVEKALAAARFTVSWPDASHLLGERRTS